MHRPHDSLIIRFSHRIPILSRSHLINTRVGEALAFRSCWLDGRLKPPLHGIGGLAIYEMASSLAAHRPRLRIGGASRFLAGRSHLSRPFWGMGRGWGENQATMFTTFLTIMIFLTDLPSRCFRTLGTSSAFCRISSSLAPAAISREPLFLPLI